MVKKGNFAIGILLIPVIIFVVTMVLIIAMKVWDDVKTTDLFPSDNPTSQEIKSNAQIGINQFPWIALGLIVGLLLLIVGTAYLVESNPLFVVISIMVIGLAIIFSVPLSNMYEDLAAEPSLATQVDSFSLVGMMFANLPLILLVAGCLFTIVMYAKRRDRVVI